MAMFQKTREGIDREEAGWAETIIGPSVKVEGNFQGEGNILVQGSVIGNLRTNKNLRISEGSMVKADIEAANILVSGEVIGNLRIREKTELTKTAKITGDITTSIISVETGAVLNGKCICGQATAESAKEGMKMKNRISLKEESRVEKLA